MPDEISMCPFERRIAGLRGTVLLRHNREHAKACARAIAHRDHPAWSQLNSDYLVQSKAA